MPRWTKRLAVGRAFIRALVPSYGGLSSGPTSAAESSLIRLINSLMARFNSLFGQNKFPVPQHREFCTQAVGFVARFSLEFRPSRLDRAKFPVNSLLAGNLAPSETGSLVTASSSRESDKPSVPLWEAISGRDRRNQRSGRCDDHEVTVFGSVGLRFSRPRRRLACLLSCQGAWHE